MRGCRRLRSGSVQGSGNVRRAFGGTNAFVDPVEIYASAIDTSDYTAKLAPAILSMIGGCGRLLDVGAGGGQLGVSLSPSDWTAIEPNANMRARLRRLSPSPQIVADGWASAGIHAGSFDTVLAATMPAVMQEPAPFLAQCLSWSRGHVVWVVPAHRGPRGLVLAGCLPSAWHNEDETPGIELTLAALQRSPPPRTIEVAWTFSAVTDDLAGTADFLCRRLGWDAGDPRRSELHDHLAAQATPVAEGYRLNIPRKSAVLVWGRSCGVGGD